MIYKIKIIQLLTSKLGHFIIILFFSLLMGMKLRYLRPFPISNKVVILLTLIVYGVCFLVRHIFGIQLCKYA